MVKSKERENKQVNVLLTGLEYEAIMILGGPTAVMKQAIESRAGDIIQLKRRKQEILDQIESDQKRIQDIDKLIIQFEKKAAEENKQRLAEEIKTKSKKPEVEAKKSVSIDTWISKWKPQFLQKLNESGGLHELEYKSIFDKIGLKTKDEADVWIRS